MSFLFLFCPKCIIYGLTMNAKYSSPSTHCSCLVLTQRGRHSSSIKPFGHLQFLAFARLGRFASPFFLSETPNPSLSPVSAFDLRSSDRRPLPYFDGLSPCSSFRYSKTLAPWFFVYLSDLMH